MKKIWLLCSASLLISAGLAVCTVQASSQMSAVTTTTLQTSDAVTGTPSVPSVATTTDREALFLSSRASLASPITQSLVPSDGPISMKSVILLLSVFAALCLLRRRTPLQDEQAHQHQYRAASAWNRSWNTQPSQDRA